MPRVLKKINVVFVNYITNHFPHDFFFFFCLQIGKAWTCWSCSCRCSFWYKWCHVWGKNYPWNNIPQSSRGRAVGLWSCSTDWFTRFWIYWKGLRLGRRSGIGWKKMLITINCITKEKINWLISQNSCSDRTSMNLTTDFKFV